MQKIEVGHTNESYRDGDKFIQFKKYNNFNHKIDYALLKELNFVPKLLKNDEKSLSWEFIESQPIDFSDADLKQIAENFKTLHNSNLKFPKTNHAARVKEYRRKIREKGLKIDVLDQYYKRINTILAKSLNNCPLHNDIYAANLIKDKQGKIYFIDWEYASMGDKHFDLAYFITGSFLTAQQEKTFLKYYENYWEEYLIQQKIFVYYLVILWLNEKDVKPFDDSYSIQKLKETVALYEYKKKNNLFKK
ncbi:thiamine kinase-like enzyme [Mycoplasmopsis mustelae]|uniref:Thiamine kinase-like enzyme n=1 Tax=Mycoplasmopsis mustelae TaxID=171289 RepID=A0A4R7UD99_9BACT|nr:phosphotransferase [Mycoplasmopsis mustelae]TDV23034.1 thiamine kinase-like enzyme [Mycoplasmopsis mustelae]